MKIYMITNTLNGKKYIGQTKSSIKKRFYQHCEKRSKTVISLAIKKYGRDSFDLKILHENIETQEELNQLEVNYIRKYKTIAPEGYNVEKGGYSPMSAATKKKISKAMTGRSITWGGKVSGGVKRLWEDKEYRDCQTKQRYEKRGKYRKGIVRMKLRKEVDLARFKIDYANYMNLSDLAEKNNISVNTIYKIIKRENIEKRGYKCNKKKD